MTDLSSKVPSIFSDTKALLKSQSQSAHQASFLNYGPSHHDVIIDGLDIDAAAAALGVDAAEVWRRVRSGQLMARSQLGKVFVYSDQGDFDSDMERLAALPNLPESRHHMSSDRAESMDYDHNTQTLDASAGHERKSPVLVNMVGTNTELVPVEASFVNPDDFLRYLNLSRTENQEIIRLTSESMNRLSKMTDEMLQLKDELIEARELQLEHLERDRVLSQEEIRRLRKEVEDLATVAKFLDRQ